MKIFPIKTNTSFYCITKNIKNISDKYLFKPVKISVGEKENILANIKHNIINIKKVDKYQKLLEELNIRRSVLIFMKTKHSSKNLSQTSKGGMYKYIHKMLDKISISIFK